jgi:hypothetical protein
MRKEMMFVSAILISSQLTAQSDSTYKSLDEVVFTLTSIRKNKVQQVRY